MSPCVTRKSSAGRAVFTVPPPPPLPGQCLLLPCSSALGTIPQGSSIQQAASTSPTAPPPPTVHPSGNVGGPHGPNLGVNPHRQASHVDTDSGGHIGMQGRGGGQQQTAALAVVRHASGQSSSHQTASSHQQCPAFGGHKAACPQHFELVTTVPHAPKCLDPGLHSYWTSLTLQQRRQLLRLPKKDLFTRIRSLYCSGCFSLVQLQYDELCSYVATQMAAMRNGSSATQQCPVCATGHACFVGLSVCSDGAITLTEDLLAAHPFGRFEEARNWDLDREQHFACGEVCGGGWCKRPGVNKCKLHTGPVSTDELMQYWGTLPEARREALMTLDEETFLAELDVSMKLQLRICKECRSNVTRAFKELKPARDSSGQATTAPAGLLLCEGHELRAGEGRVRVEGAGEACFFEKAEEVQEQKAFDATAGESDSPETIRHAETPELAREALQDSALLIFKAQVEVAFRDQTACRNALLLFTVLCHGLLEQQLANAYKELGAKQAEAELLRLLEEDEAKEAAKRERKASKAAKAKKQVAPSAAASAASADQRQSDSEDLESEVNPGPSSAPASTTASSNSKDSAVTVVSHTSSGPVGSKPAGSDKGREVGHAPATLPTSNGKQLAGTAKHPLPPVPTAKPSRTSSLEVPLSEANAALSGRGSKPPSTQLQNGGVSAVHTGTANAKAGLKGAQTPSAKAKEQDATAPTSAKEVKGHRAKEQAVVGASFAPTAVSTAKASKGGPTSTAGQTKGAKSAGLDGAAVTKPPASSASAPQAAGRTISVPVVKPVATGTSGQGRQAQPPPPPPRHQAVSAAAAATPQPPAPQLNNSNFPPLRPSNAGSGAQSPSPEPTPPLAPAPPSAGPQELRQQLTLATEEQLLSPITAPHQPDSSSVLSGSIGAPAEAPIESVSLPSMPVQQSMAGSAHTAGAETAPATVAAVAPEQGLLPPGATQQMQSLLGPSPVAPTPVPLQQHAPFLHLHNSQQQPQQLGPTAPGFSGIAVLSPAPSFPTGPGSPQPPQLSPFDAGSLLQLRGPSPDQPLRTQQQSLAPPPMQMNGGQVLGGVSAHANAPGAAALGLPPMDAATAGAANNGQLSHSSSLQSQGSGLVGLMGGLTALPPSGSGHLSNGQPTAGFGWQLPLSPQQPQSQPQLSTPAQGLHPPQPSALGLQQQQQQQQAMLAVAASQQQPPHQQLPPPHSLAPAQRPLLAPGGHPPPAVRPSQQQQQSLPLNAGPAPANTGMSAQTAAQILAAHAQAQAQVQAQAQAHVQAQAQASSQQYQQQLSALAAAAEEMMNGTQQGASGGVGSGFSLFSHFQAPHGAGGRDMDMRQALDVTRLQQPHHQSQFRAQQLAQQQQQMQSASEERQQQVLQATLQAQQHMQQQLLQAHAQAQSQAQARAQAHAQLQQHQQLLQAQGSGLTAQQAQQLHNFLMQQQAQQQLPSQGQAQQALHQAQQRQAAQHAQQLLVRQAQQQQALAAQQKVQAAAQAQAKHQAQQDALLAPWSVLGRSLQQQQQQQQQLASANGPVSGPSSGQLLFPGLAAAGGGGGVGHANGPSSGAAGMASGLGGVGAGNGSGMGVNTGLGMGSMDQTASGLGSTLNAWLRNAQAEGGLGGGMGLGQHQGHQLSQAQQQHLRQSISLSNLAAGGNAATQAGPMGGASALGAGGGAGLGASMQMTQASSDSNFYGLQPQHAQFGALSAGGGNASQGHAMFGNSNGVLGAAALGKVAGNSAQAAPGGSMQSPGAGAFSGIGGAGLGIGGMGHGNVLGGLGLGGLGGSLGGLGGALREGPGSTSGMGLGAGSAAGVAAGVNGGSGTGMYSLFGGSPSPSIAQSLAGMTSLLG